MNSLLQDIRYAVRGMAQNPGFAAAVILTLAMGIGANTTLFSLVNAILFRPPPVERPSELVSVFTEDSDVGPYGASSYLDYLDFRDRSVNLVGLAAYAFALVSVMAPGGARRENCMLVSANYFDVIGMVPHAGRFFDTPGEDFDSEPVAVLGHDTWRSNYGGDAELIGRPVTVNGQILTIIGVAPAGFTGTERRAAAGLWVPITMERQLIRASYSRLDRGSPWLSLIGRLKPESTTAMLLSRFGVIAAQLYRTHPDIWRDTSGSPRTVNVLPERQTRVPLHLRDDLVDYAGMMGIVVLLVLIVACANVANLMLARTLERRREIAVRLALGVSRGRLLRQLLTECVMLSTFAGASSLIVMLWGTDLLLAFQGLLPVPVVLDVSVDWRVVSFTAAVSVCAGILFGVASALQVAGRDVMPDLKAATATVSVGSTSVARIRYCLVVVQIALSMLLLAGAGQFLISLKQAQQVSLGFDPENVAIVTFDLHQQGYGSESGSVFLEELLKRVHRLTGVRSASLAATLPLGGAPGGRMISLDSGDGTGAELSLNLVAPGYFDAMGTELVGGREFTLGDNADFRGIAIVNETFASRYLGGSDPLGQRVRLDITGRGAEFQIVGVVVNGKIRSLSETSTPVFYLPMLQHLETLRNLETGATLIVRTFDQPETLVTPIQRLIRAMDSELALYNATTLADHVSVVYLTIRFGSTVLGLFGLLALLITTISLYGIMTFTMNQQAHGMALRIALGALRRDIMMMVLRRTLLVTATGIAIGIVVAFAATPMVNRYLYGVSASHTLILGATATVLTIVALAAGYIPARRATRTEPMQVLRYE